MFVCLFVCFRKVNFNHFIHSFIYRVEKTSKSRYLLYRRYRCHCKTRYDKTAETAKILQQHSSKRIKNTGCPMTITFKLLKETPDCYIILIWNRNHPVLSLHALSFKDISPSTALEIKGLFDQGYSAGM